jgi:peptide/nickel transport system ATP-binding protein
MSTLIITHNLGVVAELSHRVAVMYLGRVVERSTAEDIFDNPKHPYTQGLINSIPKLTDEPGTKLWAIKGVVPSPYAEISACSFFPRCERSMPGVCDVVAPEPVEVSPGHLVECLLYGKGEDKDDE